MARKMQMFPGTRRHLRDALSDEDASNKISLNRLLSLAAAGVLSFTFIKHSLVGHPLSWDLMLGYATAMAFSSSPALAGKFLGLRYGGVDRDARAAEPEKKEETK